MTYRTRVWLLGALAFGAAAIMGVIIGKTVPTHAGSTNPALLFPLFLGLCGIVMAAGWLWWRRTDDLQQQGQLLSWYWGGNCGALVMLVYLVTFYGRHSDISTGALYLFLAEFAGFGAVWLVWRLRGLGKAE